MTETEADLARRVARLEAQLAATNGRPLGGSNRKNLSVVLAFMVSRDNRPVTVSELAGVIGDPPGARSVIRSSIFGGWKKYFEKTGESTVNESGRPCLLYRLTSIGLRRAELAAAAAGDAP